MDGEETLPSPGASESLLRFTLRNGCCFSFPHDFPPGNTHLLILHVQQSRTNKQLNHPACLPCSKPQHAACCPAARTSRSTPGMPGHRCCSVVQLWLLWQSPKKKAKTSVLLVLPFTIHWEELRSYSLFSRDSSESSCKDVNLYAGDPGVNMAIHDSGLS